MSAPGYQHRCTLKPEYQAHGPTISATPKNRPSSHGELKNPVLVSGSIMAMSPSAKQWMAHKKPAVDPTRSRVEVVRIAILLHKCRKKKNPWRRISVPGAC
jgi:hypothetical protein